MLHWGPNPKTRRSLWVAIGFLCCALVALTGLVQLTHMHPDGQSAQSDCALCHTAHLVVQPAIPRLLPHTVRFVAIAGNTPQAIRYRRFFVFSLYMRPPPVDIAFS